MSVERNYQTYMKDYFLAFFFNSLEYFFLNNLYVYIIYNIKYMLVDLLMLIIWQSLSVYYEYVNCIYIYLFNLRGTLNPNEKFIGLQNDLVYIVYIIKFYFVSYPLGGMEKNVQLNWQEICYCMSKTSWGAKYFFFLSNLW